MMIWNIFKVSKGKAHIKESIRLRTLLELAKFLKGSKGRIFFGSSEIVDINPLEEIFYVKKIYG